MVLVLVLFVGSTHTKSIPFGAPPSLFHVAVSCPPKICYLKLPTSWLRASAGNQSLAQEPKYGSGKDGTGTSLARRRYSLISFAITVSSLEGKWIRFLMKQDRQPRRETSTAPLLRGTVGVLS
ncbi:hypothetical protein EDD85DRAFT_446758 [Armillaria nabsnona]|nr:hypothetical protein EDD85DRAFT_446758 [Armillaria nabsnona]